MQQDPNIYMNTKMPTQTPEGFDMLERMNGGHHAELSEWGMRHIEFSSQWDTCDLGCGGGANVERMLGYCPEGTVAGLDYSPAAVEFASEVNSQAIAQGKCRIMQGDIGDMPFDDNSFDAITAYETVYFWPNISAAFTEVLRVCKPGGLFMVCNEADGINDDASEWTKIIDGMVVYTAQQISDFMAAAGFCDIECDGNANRGWMSIVGHKPVE